MFLGSIRIASVCLIANSFKAKTIQINKIIIVRLDSWIIFLERMNEAGAHFLVHLQSDKQKEEAEMYKV